MLLLPVLSVWPDLPLGISRYSAAGYIAELCLFHMCPSKVCRILYLVLLWEMTIVFLGDLPDQLSLELHLES